jgi:diaminohydroxyphosphoribosylaminopyrimidine deaminase/5-amino-6-(5-phosphoribosylamino)uracil reductase
MDAQVNYMRRALQLAKLGQGNVAPNPMVGCVIVHPVHGIIGEGFHRKFGQAHAEVNAIQEVENQEWLSQSTLYVTLEPCSHFGKTPPCADLIIEKGIAEVVICNPDPHPLVAGKGIQKLQNAGVKVSVGLLEETGTALNRFFFQSIQKKRPFITLKWAQTRDGFIARKDGSSKWISSPESRQMVHKMRAEHQAIWVGKNTLLLDNPQLTVRDWTGPNPIRLVTDRELTLPQNLAVFEDSSAPTWIFNQKKNETYGHMLWISLPFAQPLEEMMDYLFQKGVHSVFIEGGSQLIENLLSKNLWDEANVFTGQSDFGYGLQAPVIPKAKLKEIRFSDGDKWEIFSPAP